MHFVVTPYVIVLWCASAIAVATAVATWRNRRMPGCGTLSLMMVAAVLWSFASGLQAGAIEVAWKIRFMKLGYVGLAAGAPFFLLFVFRYTDPERKLRRWLVGVLFVIPVAIIVMAATNELHGLVWAGLTAEVRSGGVTAVYVHGPAFYAFVACYCALALSAALMLVRAIVVTHRLFIWQAVTGLAGLLVPWVGLLLYLLPSNPLRGLDLMAVGFPLTGLLLFIGVSRFGLFDVMPVARSTLVESMADGVVVLDVKDRVVDANPAARRRLGLESSTIGRPIAEVLPAWAERLSRTAGLRDAYFDVTMPGDDSVFFALRVTRLSSRRGHPAGRLVMIRDVTQRRRAEIENERLVAELREALADVKTLRGLLPICSSCKKILDDKGSWQAMEKYVAAHSEAQFSHSLCPDCVRKLYPDLAEDAEKGASSP